MSKTNINPKRDLDIYDPNGKKPFIITVSSRALFDLEESHAYFEKHGEEAFAEYQRQNENTPLKPGAAYSFVKKILELNQKLPDDAPMFEVILLSRNSPETGLRVFNSVQEMGLNIYRAVFTSGTSPSKYLNAIGVDLFLSSNPEEVRRAIQKGVAAATLMPRHYEQDNDQQIRIAFDGDAVLFGDESEKIHKEEGVEGFRKHEIENAHNPMPAGPFKGFLEAIHEIQKHYPNRKDCPIRTALVTARSMPTHKRAILTLRSWGVRVDEGAFLGGRNKGPFLEAFDADLFFDDSQRNIEHAMTTNVPSGHVPFGIRNDEHAKESDFTGGGAPTETQVGEPQAKKQKLAKH